MNAREVAKDRVARPIRCDEGGALEHAFREVELPLRAVLERCAGGVALLDLRGCLLAANRAALECTGLDAGDAARAPIFDAERWSAGTEARDRLCEAVRRAAAGDSARFEAECPAPGGEARTLDFSVEPVCDGAQRTRYLVLELRDVTARSSARRAELDALRGLAAAGESAALLAHEVKNPLTAVNLALRALADGLGEDQLAVLEDLAGRLGRVERLARGAFSAAFPLELRKSEFDACELARSVTRELGRALARRGAALELELAASEVPVLADAELLREVLSELVRSALDASGAGSRVLVGVEPCEPASLRVLVECPGASSSGAGPRFAGEGGSEGDEGSLALRLAFCRMAVEGHGGDIRVERGQSGGARFVVELPARRVP